MSLDFNFENFEAGLGYDGFEEDDDDDFCMAPIAPSSSSAAAPQNSAGVSNGPSQYSATRASIGAATGATASESSRESTAPGRPVGRGRGRGNKGGKQGSSNSGARQDQQSRKPGRGTRPKRYTQADLDSLNMSIRLGRMDTVESLLAKAPNDGGIPIDTPMASGWTPLMCAASCALPDMVALLLKFKPNVNLDPGKKQALMVACDSDSSMEIAVQECVRLLLEYGATSNARDAHGMTPLMMAARKCRLAVCRLLLQHKAAVAFADLQGNTALMWAAQCGFLPIVRVLVLAGASVERENNSSETAESLAYMSEHTHVCDYLEKVRKQERRRREQRNDSADDDATGASASAHNVPSGKSKNTIGQLEIFLEGLQLGRLVALFEEHNVSFSQLATMSEDDLAKIGVVDGSARHAIAEGARRLASPRDASGSSGGAGQNTRPMHRHQIRLDELRQVLHGLNRQLVFQHEAAEYLSGELQRRPLDLHLVQDADLKDLVKKSEELHSTADELFTSADNFVGTAYGLVDGDEEGTEDADGRGGQWRSRSRSAALLTIPIAVAAVAGACFYANRLGLLSWKS